MQRTILVLRVLGALSLFAVAADHLYEYWVDHYSTVPTIGTLFLLNGIGATSLGLILLAPVGSLLSHDTAQRVLALSAFSGFALAATTLAGLLVSESEPLFGFMEGGYRPVIYAAIASEVLAIVMLMPLGVLAWRSRRDYAETRLGIARRKRVGSA